MQLHGRANYSRYWAINCLGAFSWAVLLVGLFGNPKGLVSLVQWETFSCEMKAEVLSRCSSSADLPRFLKKTLFFFPFTFTLISYKWVAHVSFLVGEYL